MPHYLTTDEMIERILTTIATGSKVQVVGTSEALRDVDQAVTRLLRWGQTPYDAGCMFWDGASDDVTVRVEEAKNIGAPGLVIHGHGHGINRLNARAIYDAVIWLIDCADRPERDAIHSRCSVVTVPPALAAMTVNELARLIFAAVKKAATGY
jgi:hypothetical protein